MQAEANPAITVVAPVYRNAETLEELGRRVTTSLEGEPFELVLVEDASPDRSGEIIDAMAERDPRVLPLHLKSNRGQHAAALAGIRAARAERVAVIDADLQDPPEAIPALLERSRAGKGVVFAARRGRYESPGRLLSSRVFKAALSAGFGLPAGSGIFMVLDRDSLDRVLALAETGPAPFLPAMVGRAGVSVDSIPVTRSPRSTGGSAYSGRDRLRSARRAARWLPGMPSRGGKRARARVGDEELQAHNEAQRRYYSGEKPNMEPRRTPYLERHVDQLLAFSGLGAGDRVLEVGCGLGRYTLPLARRGLRVEGIDISAELLERLRRVLPADAGVELHYADVLDPPADLGGFDGVIGGFVLHHLHDLERSLGAMAGLARPGGTLAFLEPNPYNPLYYAQMAISPTMTWEGDRGMLDMRRRRLLAAMRQAGVTAPSLERFGFLPPFLANRPRAARIELAFERFPPLGPVLPFQLVGGTVAPGGGPATV